MVLDPTRTIRPAITIVRGRLVRRDGAFYAADGWHQPHVKRSFAGMAIEIENPVGTVRSGVGAGGKRWSTTMAHDYGFVRGTKAIDGDAVDVFIGDNERAPNVYVVAQNNPVTGNFDESKAMLGFNTEADAKSAYLRNYDSPKFFRSMTTMTVEQFRNCMRSNARGGVKRKRKGGDPSIGPTYVADKWVGITPLIALEQQNALLAKAQAELAAARIASDTSEPLPPAGTEDADRTPEIAANSVATPVTAGANVQDSLTAAVAGVVPVNRDDGIATDTAGERNEYSADSGRWVTMEGTHVHIEGGKIDKGPADLKERTESVSRHSIEALHDPYDAKKLRSLTEAMKNGGWVGRPLLVEENGDTHQAMTGSHRTAAARHAKLEDIPVVKIDSDLARKWKEDNGHDPDLPLKKIWGMGADDEDRLRYLREIGDTAAISLMQDENQFSGEPASEVRLVNQTMASAEMPRVKACPRCKKDREAEDANCLGCGWKIGDEVG